MKAGYASIDITPPLGVELCGYGFLLKREAKGIHDPLYARAVAFESDGQKALLISCDLLGLSSEGAAAIKSQLERDAGIPPEALMLCCTHTHSGPAPLFLRSCGVMDEGYVASLLPKLAQAGQDAFHSAQEVDSLSCAQSPAEGVAYNRTYGESGPLDKMVRTLFVHRREAAPIALVHYACHPVANGVNDQFSADFPGQVVARLEEKGFDCLYITGFCGDIDPAGQRNYQLIEKHGQAISQAVMESAAAACKLESETIRYGVRNIRLSFDMPSEPVMIEQLDMAVDAVGKDAANRAAIHHLLSSATAVAETRRPGFQDWVDTYVQIIAIDKAIWIALPGEVFTTIGDSLREAFPDLFLFGVNTANGIIGYIPTADEFDREGYASHMSATLYGTFRFHKGFGEHIRDEARNLIGEII